MLLLCAIRGSGRGDALHGQGLNNGRNISGGIQNLYELLHAGMRGTCLNRHNEIAPDVKASGREQDSRSQDTSCQGVDIVVEEVDSMFYQFNGNGCRHCGIY